MTTTVPTMLGSEVRLMDSAHTGRRYRITIHLPLGYHAPSEEAWPFNRANVPDQWSTVYVLDGNWYAGMVADIIRPMSWCGSTSDAIVVGIGYPEGENPVESFREAFTRRNADLTPVRDPAEEAAMAAAHKRPTPTGDAGGFLRFIQEELIPEIERDFRADPAKRVLAGHSYGGLFGLFSLFEAPGLFDTLIIGSPTLAYGGRDLFQREAAFAGQQQPLPAKVFLFAAENEEFIDDTTLTDTLRFDAILRSRSYAGLSLTKRIFAGENHCEVAAVGFQAGLKFALRR